MSECKECGVVVEYGYHICFDEILRRNPSVERDRKLRNLYVQQVKRAFDAEDGLARYEAVMRALAEIKPKIADVLSKALRAAR